MKAMWAKTWVKVLVVLLWVGIGVAIPGLGMSVGLFSALVWGGIVATWRFAVTDQDKAYKKKWHIITAILSAPLLITSPIALGALMLVGAVCYYPIARRNHHDRAASTQILEREDPRVLEVRVAGDPTFEAQAVELAIARDRLRYEKEVNSALKKGV